MKRFLSAILFALTLSVLGNTRPDIVLIMADDLGFSDVGCFGSEIPTPNIDALAKGGVRFTNFRNTSRCCPSRAALLTGVYSHQAGIGEMNTRDAGHGNRGQLASSIPTIAERLKELGYATGMVGKWHLTLRKAIDEKPNGSWPFQRGFDFFYGTMEGAKNYFAPTWLYRNTKPVKEFEEGYFYTDALANEAVDFIGKQPKDKPLFLYTAFYAPHFPLQAPKESIEKFRGKYLEGWDALRKKRHRRQLAEGVIPENTVLSPREGGVLEWKSLSDGKRREMDLRMAIYAAQVHHLDQGVGHIVEALRKSGRLDNTLIVFLSDNGGADAGGVFGSGDPKLIGGPEAKVHSTYGRGWASLSNTPYRKFKADIHEGGVRSPLIMHWPVGLGKEASLRKDQTHIIDLAPTLLAQAVGDSHSETRYSQGMEGRDLLGKQGDKEITHFFEHLGSQGMVEGDWKLVRSKRDEDWSLFHLGQDPSELRDLAAIEKSRVTSMAKLWMRWAAKVHVLDVGEELPVVFPSKYGGVVVDDEDAKFHGSWKTGDRLPGYYGKGYRYASPNSGAKAIFEWTPVVTGDVEVRLFYGSFRNRGTQVPVSIHVGEEVTRVPVDMRKPGNIDGNRVSLGTVATKKGVPVRVVVDSNGSDGLVHIDAVQFLAKGEKDDYSPRIAGNYPQPSKDRPNILWIVADDLGPELGCYGEKLVKTPNLDRLAAQGARFTHAFSTAPVCSSARTALITGMYQTTVGGHYHRTRIKPTLDATTPPVTKLFRDAGYWVCNLGSPDGSSKRGKTDYNFEHGELFDGHDWAGRRDRQPFFAQLQIKEPHRAFVKDEDPERWTKVQVPPIYPDHEVTRRDWANYLASIEVMDKKVGQILERLEKEGLADNTLVMFFGDHGRPQARGKQWLYDGGILIPMIVRWPGRVESGTVEPRMVSMIDFPAASLVAAGLQLPEAMQGRDFLAEGYPGRERIFAARDRCGDAIDRIRCVRDKRFKYIRNFEPERPYCQISGYKKLQYPVDTLMRVLHRRGELLPAQEVFMAPRRPEEELYDLRADPFETRNLAKDPRFAPVLKSMRGQLDDWMIRTADPGAQPEGDTAYMRALMEEKQEYYEKTMERRGLDPDLSDDAYLEWWKKELGVGSR